MRLISYYVGMVYISFFLICGRKIGLFYNKDAHFNIWKTNYINY